MNTWHREGYFIGKNILDKTTLKKSIEWITKYYDKKEHLNKDFGSNGLLEFPSKTILDWLTLDESLINTVETLLGEKVLLTQADTWCKYGTEDFSEMSNQNQRMHMDYGNNTFLHPSNWESPDAVSIIIYLSDCNITGGGTAIVPRNNKTMELYKPPYIHMPGLNKYPFYNDKNKSEEVMQKEGYKLLTFRENLYKNEVLLEPEIGDILFYRLDVWHRGTPVKPKKKRIAMNLVFKKKSNSWIQQWNPAWSRKMYYGWLEQMIVQCSIKQRGILGLPDPGDKYWNKDTINYFKFRYPHINIKPYLAKL